MRQHTVGLYTLGCKVSQYETEAIGEGFESAGFKILPFDEQCDFYVINTCTVTAESDRKCRQIIRRARKINPKSHVLVCGCYAQRDPMRLAAIDGVGAVLGNEGKMSLVRIAADIAKKEENGEKIDTVVGVDSLDGAKFEPMEIKRAPRTRAYVKIEDGCDSKCTYCAIKEARGHIRSKPPADAIREIEGLSSGGTLEIVLTGIETGSYGKDFSGDYGLADLILELDRRSSVKQIRLGSLAPELVSAEFIDKVKDVKILCPHFHLSIQSGSDRILGMMKRRYTSKKALSVIGMIREKIEGVQFTTDIMVGFPGESEEDFLQTLKFMREARFLDAHIFAYSRREGTEAYGFDNQIEKSVKDERSKRLMTLKNQIRDEILEEVIRSSATLSCLVETLENGIYTGHTPSYIEVNIKAESDGCDLRGKMVKVRPVSQKSGVLCCELENK